MATDTNNADSGFTSPEREAGAHRTSNLEHRSSRKTDLRTSKLDSEVRSPKIEVRRSLWLGGIVVCGILGALLAAWKFWPASPLASSSGAAAAAKAYRQELSEPLMVAIREGDRGRVQSLLAEGADPNARDDIGDTALMRAAMYAGVPIMQLLLDQGADVNGRTSDGAILLVRAVHDAEKVRLLLDHGARADSLAMIAAARVPGSRAILEMLLAHGGMGQAQVNGYTALMAAAGNGDLEAVKCLLEHGAFANARTPNGYTALYGAAVAGNPEVISLLLERGADPNVICELVDTDGDIETPALLAAAMGHAECLRLLIQGGANVNVQGGPFDRTALICAATTGSEDVIKLLLAKGADTSATDWENDSAADWAERRGDANIAKLLRKAGARASSQLSVVSSQRLRIGELTTDNRQLTTAAVRASLPLLQHSGQKLTQKIGCVTCHQHALLGMAVGLAREHGFAVDETIAAEERAHILDHVRQRIRPLLLGTGIESALAPYILTGLAAEKAPADRQTDALVHFLILRQSRDGRWQAEDYRPPEDCSDFFNTAMAVRGLSYYAPKGRSAEIAARIARARKWLEEANPVETVEQAFHLLGLAWSRADREVIKKAAESLLARQRQDGGWSQLPSLSSDAYATGLTLFALHESAHLDGKDPAYQRGMGFLLRTQLADGSWFVATRCFPFIGYTTSGFPHGRSQFISAAATCWATMALAASKAEKISRAVTRRDRQVIIIGDSVFHSVPLFGTLFTSLGWVEHGNCSIFPTLARIHVD
jgi:ankyrin repeat protein